MISNARDIPSFQVAELLVDGKIPNSNLRIAENLKKFVKDVRLLQQQASEVSIVSL